MLWSSRQALKLMLLTPGTVSFINNIENMLVKPLFCVLPPPKGGFHGMSPLITSYSTVQA